jgi:hypothetical protein
MMTLKNVEVFLAESIVMIKHDRLKIHTCSVCELGGSIVFRQRGTVWVSCSGVVLPKKDDDILKIHIPKLL